MGIPDPISNLKAARGRRNYWRFKTVVNPLPTADKGSENSFILCFECLSKEEWRDSHTLTVVVFNMNFSIPSTIPEWP